VTPAIDRIARRALGRHGLVVSAIGFGCMGLTGSYGPADESEAIATLQRAVDLGVTLFDTADVYGIFTNELVVGRALKGRREAVCLATKFGWERHADGTFIRVNGRPDFVRAACDASLRRLGVDHLDILFQHRVDRTVPIEETVGAMATLVTEGKVRYLGLCEAAPATIRRAHAVHPMSVLQSEYSLFSRDPEGEILATTRALGIGFVAYGPLGAGLLTDAARPATDLPPADARRTVPRFMPANFTVNQQLVSRLRAIAGELGISTAQLALAWLLAQGSDIVPIPGTTHASRLEENVAAAAVRLTPESLALIAAAWRPDAVAGARSSPAALRTTNL
jgi:aryl-alcohol dehydrogenase-like predicted oxidoreductase